MAEKLPELRKKLGGKLEHFINVFCISRRGSEDNIYDESRIYLAIQLFKKNIPDSLEINVNRFFIRLPLISLAYDNFINQIKKHILI